MVLIDLVPEFQAPGGGEQDHGAVKEMFQNAAPVCLVPKPADKGSD
jgi:hypothetical protein